MAQAPYINTYVFDSDMKFRQFDIILARFVLHFANVICVDPRAELKWRIGGTL